MGTLADIPAEAVRSKTIRAPKPGLMNYERLQKYLDMSHDQIYELRKKDPTFPVLKIRNRVFARQEKIDQWIREQEQAQEINLRSNLNKRTRK